MLRKLVETSQNRHLTILKLDVCAIRGFEREPRQNKTIRNSDSVIPLRNVRRLRRLGKSLRRVNWSADDGRVLLLSNLETTYQTNCKESVIGNASCHAHAGVSNGPGTDSHRLGPASSPEVNKICWNPEAISAASTKFFKYRQIPMKFRNNVISCHLLLVVENQIEKRIFFFFFFLFFLDITAPRH